MGEAILPCPRGEGLRAEQPGSVCQALRAGPDESRAGLTSACVPACVTSTRELRCGFGDAPAERCSLSSCDEVLMGNSNGDVLSTVLHIGLSINLMRSFIATCNSGRV
ncbi:hypothetical protein AV530_016508 [Patagioenas fasciata monilis]|uniref:Uncharacterized protein n=1 Tax=Patagioenas fasciata monilis TaxID=372326 RepID=A0A1V4J317_PATFA|nr:hypothetical protein AV530_016508 [Patagioenas fasciata monilis]